MRTSRLFLTSILTASLLVLGLPAASADTIGCGTTITTDVTLTADLVCSGDGLTAGADGITIDLGGHTIEGSSVGVGVLVGYSYQVTIRNGTVNDFETGVLVKNADVDGPGADVVLERVHVAGNDTGVSVGHDSVALLMRSSVVGNGLGIWVGEVGAVSVQFSHVDGNSIGIQRAGSGGQTSLEVVNSTVSENSTGIWQWQADGAVVVGSDLINNGKAFYLNDSGSNHIERNRVIGNDTGITLTGAVNPRNVISQNRFSDNRIGVEIGAFGGFWAGEGTEFTKNTFTDNGEAGLAINLQVGSAQGVVVSGNMFQRNGFDSASAINDGLYASGVESLLAQITVSGNKAHRNADYGIEALGVTDGGKNKANNNGNPDQCLGVDC